MLNQIKLSKLQERVRSQNYASFRCFRHLGRELVATAPFFVFGGIL